MVKNNIANIIGGTDHGDGITQIKKFVMKKFLSLLLTLATKWNLHI
jgi:hypothetical protein